ncbi:hypothetical protein NQ315_005880 [Exocentrus adspersus]|uniref:CUE domain-containing protein n=1 Tax=Exocentrus adspersus TaxID=1586481 RepID=A0AAV8VRE2_9CUCU|nr:hypothetical protein NQ315_005880 [Exocentrus adspersus]
MELIDSFKDLNISDNNGTDVVYNYLNVFKNPNNLSINQIHLERSWYELRKEIPADLDMSRLSDQEINKRFFERKTEIIPALDKRWITKNIFHKYEQYVFTLKQEENISFITNNTLFIDSLDFFLTCNYHQFWCTILFQPSAVICLRSFILHPIPWYQTVYLEDEYADVYNTVFNKFLCVYKRLITFKESQSEYMAEEFGFKKLIEKKLINLPIVISLAFVYKNSDIDFVNRLTSLYFNDTSQLDFQIREVEEMVNQTLIVLEMIGGHVCGFDDNAVRVPISIKERPKVFNLAWIYSVVNYLLNTLALLNTLLQFYKPAIEICLNKGLPYRMPFTYINVYRELYEMLDGREELKVQKELSDRVFDEINLGRSEFVDVYHIFISYCLDKTLEAVGNTKQQEPIVETYLKLLTTALEDDYFICDYNMKYNVATQNEIIESCYPLDTTRTEFIVSCINKFPRHKRLQQLSSLKKQTIEAIFKEFRPPEINEEIIEPQPGPSHVKTGPDDREIEIMIRDIIDMFPHLGDGFVLQCLEAYDYNSADVINALLEENLPPHLCDIPFDSIRIPPEPEPEKPSLAYRGKKPDYDDALQLLRDKRDLQQLKTFVLEGVQYSNDYLYDDEYDDRFDDDVPIKVADNPIEEEICNPNHEELASDTSYSSDEECMNGKDSNLENNGKQNSRANSSKMNFCEDPALVRERREARYRSKESQPHSFRKKADVVGKPKGQGQEENVQKARDKKNVHKSSRANHNRKGGAQWKRNRGMIPS